MIHRLLRTEELFEAFMVFYLFKQARGWSLDLLSAQSAGGRGLSPGTPSIISLADLWMEAPLPHPHPHPKLFKILIVQVLSVLRDVLNYNQKF